jgi:hypothetical protein
MQKYTGNRTLQSLQNGQKQPFSRFYSHFGHFWPFCELYTDLLPVFLCMVLCAYWVLTTIQQIQIGLKEITDQVAKIGFLRFNATDAIKF